MPAWPRLAWSGAQFRPMGSAHLHHLGARALALVPDWFLTDNGPADGTPALYTLSSQPGPPTWSPGEKQAGFPQTSKLSSEGLVSRNLGGRGGGGSLHSSRSGKVRRSSKSPGGVVQTPPLPKATRAQLSGNCLVSVHPAPGPWPGLPRTGRPPGVLDSKVVPSPTSSRLG